jgi:hypothetical protein
MYGDYWCHIRPWKSGLFSPCCRTFVCIASVESTFPASHRAHDPWPDHHFARPGILVIGFTALALNCPMPALSPINVGTTQQSLGASISTLCAQPRVLECGAYPRPPSARIYLRRVSDFRELDLAATRSGPFDDGCMSGDLSFRNNILFFSHENSREPTTLHIPGTKASRGLCGQRAYLLGDHVVCYTYEDSARRPRLPIPRVR